MKKLILFFSILTLFINQVYGQEEPQKTKDIIGLNSSFSHKMLDPVQDLRKVNIFVEEQKNGVFQNKRLIVGASLISIFDYQKSNTDSKFGYLMRHPTSNNQIGDDSSEAVIHSFQLLFSGSVNSWLSAHAEILYNPEQSFGQGTITALGRNQLQLRKGFVVLGDLKKFPVYVAIGKMDTPFGQTGSVSPFTNSTMWHAFGGLAYGAQISFKKFGIQATVMGVQGGAQFRGASAPVRKSTSAPSKINNYTADLNYTINIGGKTSFLIGGSYLHGSAYCHGFPVMHFNPCEDNNPAVTAYGNLNINNRFILKGGFASTIEKWDGTHNPAPPLNVFEASKVTSLDVGAKYDFNINGKIRYAVSGEYSDFRAGPNGSPWERQNQIVLGVAGMVNNSSKLFVELFRTDGYVPLNFISGGNLDNPGATHSVRNAFSNGVVLGAQITF